MTQTVLELNQVMELLKLGENLFTIGNFLRQSTEFIYVCFYDTLTLNDISELRRRDNIYCEKETIGTLTSDEFFKLFALLGLTIEANYKNKIWTLNLNGKITTHPNLLQGLFNSFKDLLCQ